MFQNDSSSILRRHLFKTQLIQSTELKQHPLISLLIEYRNRTTGYQSQSLVIEIEITSSNEQECLSIYTKLLFYTIALVLIIFIYIAFYLTKFSAPYSIAVPFLLAGSKSSDQKFSIMNVDGLDILFRFKVYDV